MANVLHGEQYVKIHKAFDPDGGKLVTTSRIGDMLDKGKHLVYATELETRDENGELVCENQFVTFVRNQGGYGGTNEVIFFLCSYWFEAVTLNLQNENCESKLNLF